MLDDQDLNLIKKSELPTVVSELIDVIGMRATLNLLDRLGGDSFYVPKLRTTRMLEKNGLVENECKRFVESFGGSVLDLPKLESIRRRIRDQKIILATMQGASRADLVQQYGLSRRQIGNIRRKYRLSEESSTS